jgi:hypothetical protein
VIFEWWLRMTALELRPWACDGSMQRQLEESSDRLFGPLFDSFSNCYPSYRFGFQKSAFDLN